MTSEQFGQIALQMLAQAQIPGDALDVAVQFREIAKALEEGRAEITVDEHVPVGGK